VGQTAHERADHGYDVLIVEDGCATLSQEAHQTTLETFGVIFGRIEKAEEIIGVLDGAT